MSNIVSALCVIAGVIMIGITGFTWWNFALIIYGILLFQYLPDADRKLLVEYHRLDNEKLRIEIELLKKKLGGRR